MFETPIHLPSDTPQNMGNCGIVATAVVAERSYEETRRMFVTVFGKRETWGKIAGGATNDFERLVVLDRLGVVVKKVNVPRAHVLYEFCHTMDRIDPTGVFLVHTRGHIQVVQGRKVIDQRGLMDIDLMGNRRSLVQGVYKIVSNNPQMAVDLDPETDDDIVTNKPRRTQVSKIDQAKVIYAANSTLARKDMIALFVKELSMSTAAASTYQNTCKKWFDAQPKTTEGSVPQEVEATVIVTNAPAMLKAFDPTKGRLEGANWLGLKEDISLADWQAEMRLINELAQ